MRFGVDEGNRQENKIIVIGKTRCGMMKGIWKSAESLTKNKAYQVELSVGESCEVDIWENEKCVPSVYIGKDIHVITSKKKRGDDISFSASIHNIGIYPYS